MSDAEKKTQAEQLKAEGNKALGENNYEEALKFYTEALSLDNNAVLYSNRSAAYSKNGEYQKALEDAEKTIEMRPSWIKGWSRKGTALCFLKRYEEAKIAFDEGLKIEPENAQMIEGLSEAEKHLTGPAGSQEMRNPFSQPGAIQKLDSNPQTSQFMKDPMFRHQITTMASTGNMQSINDPRMIQCLGVLMGVNFQTMGDGPVFPDLNKDDSDKSSKPSFTDSSAKYTKSSSKFQETESKSNNNTKALAAKEKGNAAYKDKDFDEALRHYNEAIALDPNDMTFLNNKAAVYFEKKEYDECIAICEKAVDIGRENRADYTVIAKAFGRLGKAYLKMEDDENALKYLNKALSEHRTPDITKLTFEIDTRMKETARLSYINPEVALEEKST